jgi:hypothetical protein
VVNADGQFRPRVGEQLKSFLRRCAWALPITPQRSFVWTRTRLALSTCYGQSKESLRWYNLPVRPTPLRSAVREADTSGCAVSLD